MAALTSLCLCVCRYYRDGSHCEKCDPSCELCTGPGPSSCRVCSPPLLELQGTKLCVERCPQRFYEADDICAQCHISCQTCTGTNQGSRGAPVVQEFKEGLTIVCLAGTSPQDCLTCDWGSTLKDNVCYPRCEEGLYFSLEVSSPIYSKGQLGAKVSRN